MSPDNSKVYIEPTDYTPGVCNINTTEVAYRRKWAYIGLVSAVVLLAVLLLFNVERIVRLVVFLPLFIGIVGVLQVRNKFCVSYGASGLQNATEGSAAAAAVSTENAKKDKAKANQMNLTALVISVLLTAASFFLP